MNSTGYLDSVGVKLEGILSMQILQRPEKAEGSRPLYNRGSSITDEGVCGLLEFRVREFWAETASPTPSSGKVEA